MSRIDVALKLSEVASGVAVTRTGCNRRHAPFAAHAIQFRRSRASRSRTSQAGTGRRPGSCCGAAGWTGIDTPADAELQARLVTGTSSTVSLEQYRKLAAVLHEAQVQSQTKTVMITSALPHEGKTLTVVNLALTLTESYARRVLVIDADLRAPSLHTVFDISNQCGLSEALQDGTRALPLVDLSGRLTVMTAGRPGPAPLAGLSSPRMAEVLAECSRRFDWVLIDTPPVGVLPDAQVLARLVGEVILVIGAGSHRPMPSSARSPNWAAPKPSAAPC